MFMKETINKLIGLHTDEVINVEIRLARKNKRIKEFQWEREG